MRRLILFFFPALCFGAVQGFQANGTYPGYAGLNLPNSAPWTTIGASTQPWRLEVRIFGSLSGGLTQLPGLVLGTIQLFGSGNSVVAGTNYEAEQFSGPAIYGCCEGHNDMLIRVQRDVANNQYTLEVQDPANNYNPLGYATGAITTYGATSWAAYPIQVTVGQNIYVFIRWYSTVVPQGTPIAISDSSADLAYWNGPDVNTASGTITDSVHGLAIRTQSAVSLSLTNAPVYPPVCNPGTQQTVRVGTPLTLNGSASTSFAGDGVLYYQWTPLSQPVLLPSWWAAQPVLTDFTAGPLAFQLTVKDSAGQSATCIVHHGAVATDSNGVVALPNPALTSLIGPFMRWGSGVGNQYNGANPWPWYDATMQEGLDNQIANMTTYPSTAAPIYRDFWDDTYPGTVQATVDTTAVTGVGTHFNSSITLTVVSITTGTSTVLNLSGPATGIGPGDHINLSNVGGCAAINASLLVSAVSGSTITVPVNTTSNCSYVASSALLTGPLSAFCSGGHAILLAGTPSTIIIWYPLNDGTGRTGRNAAQVASCADDTHLTLQSLYGQNGLIPETCASGGCSYSVMDWTQGWLFSNAPANYYDDVEAFYIMYYRSGIDTYRTWARQLADWWWAHPKIDRGNACAPLTEPTVGQCWFQRAHSALGLVLRAMDNPPYDMWSGLHHLWDLEMSYVSLYLPANGIFDPREVSYILAEIAYCGLYDTDSSYRSACQASLNTAITTIWTNWKTPDGAFESNTTGWGTQSFYPYSTPPHGQNPTTVTLSYGSNLATCSNATYCAWGSMSPYAHIWFLSNTDAPWYNNGWDAHGDSTYYGEWVQYTSVSGQNDIDFDGTYTGTTSTQYCVKITATGNPDTFSWGKGGSCSSSATGVAISNGQSLDHGIILYWLAYTGHAVGDQWTLTPLAVTSPATMLLDRPYADSTCTPSCTRGWEIYNSNQGNTSGMGYGSLVYQQGLMAMALNYAGQALATSYPAASATAYSYSASAANWIANVGQNAPLKAVYYYAGGIDCQAPVPKNSSCDYFNYPADPARVFAAEPIRGLTMAYANSGTSSLKSLADTFMNGLWAKPGTCPTGSTLCVPDGSYNTAMDITLNGIDIVPGAWQKWVGQFYGVNNHSAWPAVRMGGLLPSHSSFVYVTAAFPAGAATMKVTVVEPTGLVDAPVVCAASPCMLTLNSTVGNYQYALSFYSSGGALIASEPPQPVVVQ